MYKENAYTQNLQNIFLKNNIPEHMESLIKQNQGKKAKIYLSFPDSIEWRDKIFYGIIKASGTNYILIDNNNTPILLPKIYINFIEFEEPLIY